MIKQLFIKNKYGLIIASVTLLLVSYQLALKKTLEASQLNSRLKLQLENTGSLSYQPGYLERKNDNLNKLVKSFSADTATLRSNIINSVALVAGQENVKVTAVPLRNISFQSDRLVMQQLELEGQFPALLKTAQKLYALQGIGLIRSVTLKKPAQNQAKKNSLILMEVSITAIRQ